MQSWALVTGATVGIGESFTRLLAQNGYNIVLVARDLPRLQERAKTLESTFGIATTVIQADLATDAGCKTIEDFIANNQIDVLINNAGFGINKAFVLLSTQALTTGVVNGFAMAKPPTTVAPKMNPVKILKTVLFI